MEDFNQCLPVSQRKVTVHIGSSDFAHVNSLFQIRWLDDDVTDFCQGDNTMTLILPVVGVGVGKMKKYGGNGVVVICGTGGDMS